MAASLAKAAGRLPANKNVKWALGANLWNYFPRVSFTDILDVMRDTVFIGIRLTQFPGILETYGIKNVAELERMLSQRGLNVITISFNGPAHDAGMHKKILANASEALTFLKSLGAHHLVVFSPTRLKAGADVDAGFRTMCEGFNQIGELASGMGMKAGLHNHLGQMVEGPEEVDRCMSLTDPKLFHFSPDTAHLHLANCNVVETLRKHKSRLMLADYKDAKWTTPAADVTMGNGKVYPKDSKDAKFHASIYDLGDGEIDFPGCHRILKSIDFKGWLCVDLDTARNGPRASYERCGAYVVKTLEPIYV